MAEPTWEETAPIEVAPEPRASAAESAPTWDNTFDPEEKYGTPGQMLATGLEGAAEAGTFGLSTGIEKTLGVPEEDIRGRREANPGTHAVGQGLGLAASLLIPGLGEGEALHSLSAPAVLKGIGEAAAKLGPEGEGIAAAIARGGLRGAAETAAFQGTDEVSKMLSGDPNQSVETAAINVGMAGLLGGGLGGSLGAISPLWKSASSSKAGQALADFKGRAQEWLNNPNPAEALTQELQGHVDNMKSIADETYGASGLKAREIEQVLPKEVNPKMISHGDELLNSIDEFANKVEKEPGIYQGARLNAVSDYADRLAGALSDPAASPAQRFSAIEDFKKGIGPLKNWNALDPGTEKKGAELIGDLYKQAQAALEDSGAWGEAANRQKAINNAFSDYLPALKNFEKRFTSFGADGTRQVDPGKIQTYLNQLGKPNAEIKKEMLQEFLEASEKYQKVIEDTHSNLGLENPFQPTPLTAAYKTLETLTPGAKLFDALVKKGLGGSTLGKGVGGGIGGTVGAVVGHPAIGALIGEHSLGPLFDSVFPSIIKPILEAPVSAEGAKAATDYGMMVVKGVYLVEKAAQSIFDSEKETVPLKLVATNEKIKKLDEKTQEYAKEPDSLVGVGGSVGHYMPSHASALGATTANAVNYINSKRPQSIKPGPLDKEIEPGRAEKVAFNRTLAIAQQPLTVMQHLKDNSIQLNDLKDLHALYPSLYGKLREQVFSAMAEHVSKARPIPYEKRMGLSLFLGQPLDATLKPESIMAAQATYLDPESQNPQPGTVTKPKKSSSHLSKLSELAETPSEARQSSLRK